MSKEGAQHSPAPRPFWLQALARQDVLAGLMFIGFAVLGLWLSRNYPMGTAVRMGTGYVPRLLCWILLLLGVVVMVIGLRAADAEGEQPHLRWRPIVLIPAALVVFALTIERLGIVIAGLMLIGIGALGGREVRILEVIVAAVALVFFTWAIFIWALGLPIPVWPEW
jgi:putative tricarboxylic transport membrane protein